MTSTPADLASYTNAGSRHWTRQALLGVAIPESSKRFLEQVGLPSEAPWTFRFGTDGECLPRLVGQPHLRIFGYDDGQPLCLDESASGRVVAVYPDNRRHINQSIECFGNSLQLYIACIFQYSGIQDPARLALAVDDLEMALKNIDATAWLDLDNWWPVVIEHFRLSY